MWEFSAGGDRLLGPPPHFYSYLNLNQMVNMQKFLSRTERKTAARLMIKMARTHGVWTDGNRIYRGAELDDLLRKAVHKLVNDVDERREQPHRYTNAMSILRMVHDNPKTHNVPASAPEMLVARARTLIQRVNAPGTMEHFLLVRRLGRKIGTIGRTEFPLPLEKKALGSAIDRAAEVVTTHRIYLDHNELCEAGVRLTRDSDGKLFSPDGGVLSASGESLIGLVRPVRGRITKPAPAPEPELY